MILPIVSPSLHNSKISFSSSSWFSFSISFSKCTSAVFLKLFSTNACVACDHHQKSVRACPLRSACLITLLLCFFVSLWIRATISICLLTRTKFDYLKVPNSATSATRARPCSFIIDFFAIIDSWKLITKKIVTSAAA